MTTPKRNEAVAPVAWVERTEEGHTRMWPGDLSLWASRPADPEPLYSQQTIDALQGEVSRLRGRTDELEAFIRHWIGDGLLQTFNNREIFRAAAATILAPNLEPPTDG